MTGSDMEWTGERFLPKISGTIALEHIHRYLVARELAKDKVVLDIACGEGYGSAMLAEIARHVSGVDISAEAIVYATEKYRKGNLQFLVGSCAAIPLPDDSIDLVVSFETIEHHVFHKEMMEEVKRVLKPDGLLIISSPDKREYSDLTGYKNPYHVKELYRDEFEELVLSYFKNICSYGQRVMSGSVIFPEDTEKRFLRYCAEHEDEGKQNEYKNNLKPIYNLLVASNSELKVVAGGVLEEEGVLSNVVAFKNDEIDKPNIIFDSALIENSLISERDLLRADLSHLQNKYSIELSSLVKEHDELIKQYESLVIANEVNKTKLNSTAMLLDGMRKSHSWRLTGPLRNLKSLILSLNADEKKL